MDYVQELTLDLNSNNAYPIISAKQADSARYILIHLTKNNIPYNIDSTHSFYFRMRKPDGYGIINPVQVVTREATRNVTQSDIMVQLTSQALAVAGRGYADLVEYDGDGNVLSTIAFIVNIMAAPAVAERAVSSDEFQQLTNLVSDAENVIHDAEAWARGTKNNEEVVATYEIDDQVTENNFDNKKAFLYIKEGNDYVSAVNTTYSSLTTYYGLSAGKDNNAKYYAEQAATSASEILNMSVSAAFASVASVTTALVDGHYSLYFGLPKGDTGEVGASPNVSATSIIEGTTVNFSYDDNIAQGTSFFVSNGKSGVAISSNEPSDSAITVWIKPNGEEGIISAGLISYDSSAAYNSNTVGKQLQALDDVRSIADAAASIANEAMTSAQQAVEVAADVDSKITNPSLPTSTTAVLTVAPSIDNTTWTTAWSTSIPMSLLEDAPAIKVSNEESIPLVGAAYPSEFGLAPRNSDTADGSYYSLPSTGIPLTNLDSNTQGRITNTDNYFADIYVNDKQIQGTKHKYEISSTGVSAEISNEETFFQKVNYKIGTYTFKYRQLSPPETSGWYLVIDTDGYVLYILINLSDYGIELASGQVGTNGDEIVVNYNPYILINGLQTNILITNENLLDNAWFTINQRGITEYNVEGGTSDIVAPTYICDRWLVPNRANDTTADFDNGREIYVGVQDGIPFEGIKITSSRNADSDPVSSVQNSTIVQILSKNITKYITNQPVTISAKYSKGDNAEQQIRYASTLNFVEPLEVTLSDDWKITLIPQGSGNAIFKISATDSNDAPINIHAVKLEIGRESTLSLDIPPKYNEELLKCQRYYIRYNRPGEDEKQLVLGQGFANTANIINWEIPLPCKMVDTPVITCSGTGALLSGWVGTGAVGTISGSSLAVSTIYSSINDVLYVDTTVASFTSQKTYLIVMPAKTSADSSDRWIALSAETTML